MFDEFSKREFILIIVALLVAGAVVAAGAVYVTNLSSLGTARTTRLDGQAASNQRGPCNTSKVIIKVLGWVFA